jgi:Tfp pilus assembly protein PilN
MNAVFNINFRREAYQREVARTRARVVGLGVWLAYFGVAAVVFGLYGLNCVMVSNRTRILERQAAMMRAQRTNQVDWSARNAEMAMVERGIADARRWRERLERLAVVLPSNARLTSIEFNPGNVSGAGDWNRLVVAGSLRAGPDQDRMRAVTDLVTALQKDSMLSRQFHVIRLANTRVTETSGSTAEFVIECRP